VANVKIGQVTHDDQSRRCALRAERIRHAVVSVAVACSMGALCLTLGTGTAGATATGSAKSSTTTGPSGSHGTTSTIAPGRVSQSQIDATEAQVAAIGSQISQQQKMLDRADEQYNQAVVNLTATESALQATTASINAARAKLVTDRSHLRDAAIQSYIGATSTEAVAQIFAAPSSASQTQYLYEKLGAGNVAAEVAKVKAGQHELTATQSKLLAEQKAQNAQLDAENQTRQAASAASALSEATLAQIKGALAQQIAQQAAAQAAGAALTAASATTPAAKHAAAAQASQAAQVASTVGGGSAAAASATTAANQAAGSSSSGSSSGGGTITAGHSPQAPGLAAVHGAMKYLGVPYVWGGASSAGVDCSGLTMLAWARAGVSLLHSAADQYAEAKHVSLSDLEPGDLLFYDLDGTGIDHVVMYVGPILDGQATAYGSNTIIQAAHTGTVVTFNALWQFGLVGAARP
jgi:peptidoglycan DL-endopeptidase RipA